MLLRSFFFENKKMKTYIVHFIWQGRAYQEQITCNNPFKARQLIRGRYEGAKITYVQEI